VRDAAQLTWSPFQTAMRPSEPAPQPWAPWKNETVWKPVDEIADQLSPESVDASVPDGPTATSSSVPSGFRVAAMAER